jgi:maltose alpha-D-glucosyltransferase/alpha-amylase
VREYRDEIILRRQPFTSNQPVELDLRTYKGRIPVEMLGRTPFPPIGDLTYLLTLPAWGFYWFVLAIDAKVPEWHDERPVPVELPVLVIPEGLRALFASQPSEPSDIRGLMAARVRTMLEQQILPDFLAARRWFAGKGQPITAARLTEQDEWQTPEEAGCWDSRRSSSPTAKRRTTRCRSRWRGKTATASECRHCAIARWPRSASTRGSASSTTRSGTAPFVAAS